MNKALPCKKCKTDRHLRWKNINEKQWWIVCEGCGHGPDKSHSSMKEAGEHWNERNE